MSPPLTRRRFINLFAAGAGLALSPCALASAKPSVSWRGHALGADAEITLVLDDEKTAQSILLQCVAEIHRLESIFSLFRRNSSLVQLNQTGKLEHPPKELVEVLRESQRISALSDGAFDVTIQPLWQLYAQHFAKDNADRNGPSAQLINATLQDVGWQNLEIGLDHIRFKRPNMALSLNAIAQGYITDHIADFLQTCELENTLINLGEFRGIGHADRNRPWQIALPDFQLSLPISNQAIATSGTTATRFDPNGRFHHLIDPRNGRPSPHWHAVSVLAENATLADALSTALSITSEEKVAELFYRLKGTKALLKRPDGQIIRLG